MQGRRLVAHGLLAAVLWAHLRHRASGRVELDGGPDGVAVVPVEDDDAAAAVAVRRGADQEVGAGDAAEGVLSKTPSGKTDTELLAASTGRNEPTTGGLTQLWWTLPRSTCPSRELPFFWRA